MPPKQKSKQSRVNNLSLYKRLAILSSQIIIGEMPLWVKIYWGISQGASTATRSHITGQGWEPFYALQVFI
jgi:hypothetical protein